MSSNFTNDYDIVVDFGRYKGKKIKELPDEYINSLLSSCKDKQHITDAIKRIKNRKGVTTLIKNIKSITFTPIMLEVQSKIKPIYRDPDLNPSLFGSFVEYLIKSHMGLSIDDQSRNLLSQHEISNSSNQKIKWIYNSFIKPADQRTILDICSLSLSHSILMNNCKEKDAKELYMHVKENEDYYNEYLKNITLPILDKNEQDTCDKICIGCVTGVIDMISKEAIIDIKCRQIDNIDEYQKQLFTYACLHYLKYNSNFQRCEVYNFLTGKQYAMALGDSCQKYAKYYIKTLGSYCQEHVKLFS